MKKDLDNQLYKEYFEGKEEIFNLLYSKYKNKIEYFVFNIVKDKQKAEDITQDVFIYVFQNQPKGNYSFKNYVYFVAKSRAISYIEKEKRRREINQKYLQNENDRFEPDVIEFIEKEETKKELIEAINELEDKYKNAMYLIKVEELSYKETSEILGEPIQNIKNFVHRGKKQLRKVLIKKGVYKENKLPKFFITILCVGTLITGVIFAKELKEYISSIKQNKFGTYNAGITTAIKNDYYEDLDMDYINSNNTELKIDSIILDDYNLGVVCNILVKQEYLNNINQFEFENTLIMNENNEILYAKYEDLDEFYDYCEKNNLYEGVHGDGYSDGSYTGRIKNIENNNIIFSFSTSSNKFPESQKLYIRFNKIKLSSTELDENLDTNYIENIIDGTWEITVDLENISNSRKTIEYEVTNINDTNTIINTAKLSMANMKLELITNSKKIDFRKMQNKDLKNLNVYDMIPINEIYLENSKGKIFYQTASGDNGYETLEDGKIKYYTTLDYTYFDKTENIKIYLKTNKNEEIIIEMSEK